jgi:uncharacterized protein (DUF697 family)
MTSPGSLPVAPKEVLALARDLRAGMRADRPLVVAGGGELAAALRRELAKGGVASAVRDGSGVEDAAVLVHLFSGPATDADLALLRRARKANVPLVGVVIGREGTGGADPPYVLPENAVHLSAGSGFPVDEIAAAIARAVGEGGTALAARLPVLREAVVDRLIAQASRQNAVVGAAVFVPGADMPVLTLNQVRLLMRIADAYGFELDRERIPEVLGVIGGGFGLRAAARSLLGIVPVAGWAVKAVIAYGGTRTLGEAARRYFSSRAPVTRIAGDRVVFPR